MSLSLSRLVKLYFRLRKDEVGYARYLGVNVGEGCSLENVIWGSEPYLITIGNRVQVTDGVKFFTHGGAWVYRQYCSNFDFFGRIFIGDGTYIGNHVMIMPGVTLGKGCIVGAGSVVTKSFASGLVIAGNPARCICTVKDSYEKNKKFNVGSNGLTLDNKKNIILKSNIFIEK